jgi:flavorubredoxin
MNNIEFKAIKDSGDCIQVGKIDLHFIPAHYLHSSGNFHVYDPVSKIYFSGDVGAALEPKGTPFFVEDFNSHIDKMQLFHQRWMPSNKAKNEWVKRVRSMDIKMLVPQHGRMFRGKDVKLFLDWFEALEVGIASNS